MARRPALIKAKQKAQKKSKTEQYLINRKYCGDEPVFTSQQLSYKDYTNALLWYNYMCDGREAKEYLQTYLQNTGRDSDVKKLRSVPDNWIKGATTMCWQARMWSLGAKLPEGSREFFESRLKVLLDRDYTKASKMEAADSEMSEPVKKVEHSIQDRMSLHLDGFICEIEEKIDEFITTFEPGFKMYEWLQGKEVAAVQARRMHDFFNPQLLEIEEAYEGNAELKEGYEGYSKLQFKKLFGFFVMIVEDLEQYMNNSKKERKPRTKKPITAEKKLKDFKYLDFDNARKIQSVQPVRIIGATELWTFNTKYNQLTVLRALGSGTLHVHRTAITGFDPTASSTKKLRAKDIDAVLKEVQNAGKVVLRNVMKNARGSDQKLQERMNENTLLLRVV